MLPAHTGPLRDLIKTNSAIHYRNAIRNEILPEGDLGIGNIRNTNAREFDGAPVNSQKRNIMNAGGLPCNRLLFVQ